MIMTTKIIIMITNYSTMEVMVMGRNRTKITMTLTTLVMLQC